MVKIYNSFMLLYKLNICLIFIFMSFYSCMFFDTHKSHYHQAWIGFHFLTKISHFSQFKETGAAMFYLIKIKKLPICSSKILNIPYTLNLIESRMYITQMLIIRKVNLISRFSTNIYFRFLWQLYNILNIRPFNYPKTKLIRLVHYRLKLIRTHFYYNSLNI